ncbi:MAG: ABC transporter permease [Deltaproteobacteria bacterium]|nr:ABC transporter permease [Deltaproteobacteria bacterium]
MLYLRLAARNVFRQYGRTAFSMVSIIAGVAVLILGRGLMTGMKENAIRGQIDNRSGHVLVVPADYPTGGIRHPVDNLLEVDDDTDAWLDENAVSWTRRVVFVPRAVHGMDGMRIRVFGFDPDTEEAVFPRTLWHVNGKVPMTAEDGLLVSRGLARVLDLEPGGTLILEVRTATGALNALEVPVSGVVTTSNPAFDRIGAFAPKPLVQDLLISGEGFSHLAVKLRDRNRAVVVAAELHARFGESARVSTWAEETEAVMGIMDIRQRMLDLLALALMAVAATGIANTVLMAAFERVREIGTLRALGMTRRGVVGMFVTEGLFMGIVGSLIGALLGGWAVWHWSVNGIDLTPMIEQAGEGGTYDAIPFSAMLYTEWSEPVLIAAVVFGVVVATLASIYPAVIASRLVPAEAVRAD